MPLSEHVYCVAVTLKMTERVEQQICIKFCIKLEQSSAGNSSNDSGGCSYGQLVIGSFIRTMHSLMHHVCAEFFHKTSNHPVDSVPNSQDLAPCYFWLFPKLKSPLKEKRFQPMDEIQETRTGQQMTILTTNFAECFEQQKRRWENCMRSPGAYFKGD